MEQILNNIAASAGPLSTLLYILIAAYVIDTGSGALAALSAGSFSWAAFWTSVQSHGLKVALILLQALSAVALSGTDTVQGSVLVASTILTATQYLLSAIASTGLNIQAAQDGTKGLPASVAGGRVARAARRSADTT
jgi:hypothetical protein